MPRRTPRPLPASQLDGMLESLANSPLGEDGLVCFEVSTHAADTLAAVLAKFPMGTPVVYSAGGRNVTPAFLIEPNPSGDGVRISFDLNREEGA